MEQIPARGGPTTLPLSGSRSGAARRAGLVAGSDRGALPRYTPHDCRLDEAPRRGGRGRARPDAGTGEQVPGLRGVSGAASQGALPRDGKDADRQHPLPRKSAPGLRFAPRHGRRGFHEGTVGQGGSPPVSQTGIKVFVTAGTWGPEEHD